MALNIKYTRIFDIPVGPDAISTGSTNLTSIPVNTGDFNTTINIVLKTYTFDLRGISEEKAQEIIDTCNSNAEELAKGNIDIQNISGEGIFTYRDANCLPFSYQDGGSVRVAGTTNNISSFQVTCLTNVIVANI